MLVIPACAPASETSEADPPEHLAQVVGADRDPPILGGSTPTECEPNTVWTSTSRRIEIRSYSFWEGSSGYRAERAALTATQREALSRLCVRPPSDGPVLADISAFQIAITDASGRVKSYRAAIDDLMDGDETDHSLPTLDYASLKPFLATFKCLHAVESRAAVPRRGETVEDVGPPWIYAPELPTDPGCLNGVFAGFGCQDAWIKVTVRAQKRMTLATEACIGAVQLKLFDQRGETQLAASPVGSRPSCPSLSYSFAPGSYLLNLRKTNAGGACTNAATGGDYWLRVVGAP